MLNTSACFIMSIIFLLTIPTLSLQLSLEEKIKKIPEIFNLTNYDNKCLDSIEMVNCFYISKGVLNYLSISSLSDFNNMTPRQKHNISGYYFNIGKIQYYGLIEKNPNLEESLSNFIIASYLGNEKAQFNIYILIHNELNEQIVSSKKFQTILHKDHLLNQISQTKFYSNFNYSKIHTLKEQKQSIALSFLMASALAHYPPALNTLGYKYLMGYGLPSSCEIANKYYKQSSYETAKGILLNKNVISYSYYSLVDYEYVEKKFSNEIRPNSEDELEYYKINAKEGKLDYIKALAQKYLFGQGIKQNYEEAFQLFELGEKLNDTLCIYYLGEMYLNGWGTKKNYQKAFDLFTTASNHNYSQAFNSLGYMYYYGFGVPENQQRAYDLFKKSAFSNTDHEGYYNLMTLLLEGGKGITPDFSSAYQYAGIAADGGKTFAQYIFAMMNHYKIGSLLKVCDAYIQFFKVIAERNVYDKMKFDMAISNYYNKNYKSAALLYIELAEEGSEIGQMNAALLLKNYDIFIDKDYQKYLTYKYMKMASKSNVYATLNLGDFYFTGYGKIKKNYKKALKHYETVKTKSALLYPFYLSHSLFNIGLMNSFGFGVKKNITKAYMYYNATKNMKTAARYPAYLMIKFDEYINNSTINEIVIKVIKECAMGLISPIWKIFLYLTFIVFYIGFFISIKSQKDT